MDLTIENQIHLNMNLLLDLQQKGTTVMVATHDRVLLERYRRRTIVLNRGYLIEDGMQTGGTLLDDDDEEIAPA